MYIILGPTGAGKTALAIAVAQKTGVAIISADSRQVYAGLNIGTAKPAAAHRTNPHPVTAPDIIDGVPHYLLNITSPSAPYTLANWQHDAYAVIDSFVSPPPQHPVLRDPKHRVFSRRDNSFPSATSSSPSTHDSRQTTRVPPIITGGTMLYLDSLLYNYNLPAVPPNPALRKQLEPQDVNTLHQNLLKQDPESHKFIESKNKRRIIRALEVITATGQPFSRLRQKRQPKYDVRIIGLFPGWEILQKNIEQRAQQIITDGLIEETRQLQAKYSPALPLLQTMNYRQAAQIIDGTLTTEAATTEMVKANLRYAHRQMSWWKRNKNITWFASSNAARRAVLSP